MMEYLELAGVVAAVLASATAVGIALKKPPPPPPPAPLRDELVQVGNRVIRVRR